VTQRRRRRRREGGFTLIELMISLLVSSLLVILVLSIFARMSFAYREQQQIVGIQQVLAAARTALETDARQAGLALAQGFTIANDTRRHSPLRVVNRSDGPDEVGFYYADPSVQALVTALPSDPDVTLLMVDDPGELQAGEVVVLSTPDVATPSPIAETDANIAVFTSCVVQVQSISGNLVELATGGDWGAPGNAHCSKPVPGSTMIYKFVAHYWRIDPARPELGALQLDRTGNLNGRSSFEDQAYGVTDLQVATYFYDGDGVDTSDPDDDGDRDWMSSDEQELYTSPRLVTDRFPPPLMMTMTLVARTTTDVEGVFSSFTPQLVDPSNPSNNPIGDRDAVALPSATDPMLGGYRIYRFVTYQVDLRNLGVGL
jgi:prepilin-type N-terminal cleavage/methylation domain-containing protein